ncbi:MAG: hypothetical protein M3237_15210 [Actinomycetota bacterium]|nr:hypothetical protein [Actinomycetota bacterium]
MYAHESLSGCGCGGGVSTMPRGKRTPDSSRCGCGGGSCDGLTCSCRPRFFDGQLITAADFKRLDTYIVEKSRLHNRYLHGVGVVCGLEAVCNPCDDTVTVRTGYALGPCGEDIVVCADARVDVAALVKEQRRSAARSDCGPYSDTAKDCEAARQKWILSICYDEHQVRGVANLKQAGGSCGCGGSCGGSCGSGGCGGAGGCGGSCGGGCGGSRSTPTACEPTQICEGYTFKLTKVPPRQVRRTDREEREHARGGSSYDESELPARVLACLTSLRTQLTSIPSDPEEGELAEYCCQLKADLTDLAETSAVTDCSLTTRLNAIECPDTNDQDVEEKSQRAIQAMLQIAVDLFRMCACSALLPPCDVDSPDDCVPLAVLTVRSSDLRVLDICNWSARTFAITMPTLQYWLGWIPIFDTIRSTVERLCCEPARRPAFDLQTDLKVRPSKAKGPQEAPGEAETLEDVPTAEGGTAEERTMRMEKERAEPAPQMAVARLAAQYAGRWNALSGLEATVLGALGGEDSRGNPLASGLELDNPLEALVLGRVGVRAVEGVIPPDLLRGLVGGAGQRRAPESAEPPAVDEDRIAGLEAAVEKLTRTVNSQARTIRTLRDKGPEK